MPKHVGVIGAGPSGITVARNLPDQGLQVTISNYRHDVDGNWVYSDTEGHSSVFETTQPWYPPAN
jgi:cation diffusion facilitator CzcD-associated flavoprotein CzcO